MRISGGLSALSHCASMAGDVTHLRRIGAIAESATLAVDAKAKALKAAGERRHRLRRRRARLPHAGPHRRGGRRRLPRPEEPPLHARRRPARAARGHRRQDGARLRATTSRPRQVLVTNGGKQAVYNTFAALLDPGDEVLAARAVLDHLPRAGRARRGDAGRPADRRVDRLQGHGRAARGGAHRAHQGARCSCRRRTRPARSTRPTEIEAIGGGRSSTGMWVITDEIYEHLVYGEHALPLDAGRSCPSWPTAASSSTAWPRPTP